MRGPQGPVRGGVTRCGRPPPLCRGRGRGKTSRLPTPSSSSTARDGQLDMPINVAHNSIPLRHVECDMMFPVDDEMLVCPRRVVRFPGKPLSRTGGRRRLPVGFLWSKDARCEKSSGKKRVTTVKRREESSDEERKDDKVRRIPRCIPRSTGFLAAGSQGGFSYWRSSALGATWWVPRPWPALKSTASGRSRPGTVSCAASRPDRRRPSRLTMGYRTPPRLSARCATCPRSPQPHGVAPSSPTPYRRPVRSSHRHRMRACRGRGAPTSRD